MVKNRIKEYRTKLGISQSDFCEKLGCNPGKTIISLIENGHVLPTQEILASICDALGCEAGDLYDSSELRLVLGNIDRSGTTITVPDWMLESIEDALDVLSYKSINEWFRDSYRRLLISASIVKRSRIQNTSCDQMIQCDCKTEGE